MFFIWSGNHKFYIRFLRLRELQPLETIKKIRSDQELLSLLVTMKFGKFKIYQRRLIFVIV
jgi:hypothetical protein